MGICFSKRDVLGDDRPIMFAEEESLSSRIKGRGSNFEPPFNTSDRSSSSDSNNSGFFSKKEISSPFPVSYSKVFHHNVDSCGRSTTTSQQVTVGPGSVNEKPHRLIDLLDETTLVITTKRSPTRLFALSKSSRKSTSTSIELVHEFVEDAANPKTYSRNSSVDTNASSVIYNSIAADHISKHSQINEATLLSCSEKFKKSEEDYSMSLPPISNIDPHFNISDTKTVPDLSKDSNEGSNNNGVLGVFNDETSDGSGRVDEAALKFNISLGSFGKKDVDSQILADGRLRSLSIEDEKAFGSPFCVDSKSSSEGREENKREYWQNLTPDELSDSSSDLFDIDFRKEERRVF